jgi:uncharacterized tellurite resistance protein B-like protein
VFERLKDLFAARGIPADDFVQAHGAAYAAAMLLLEVAWADHDISSRELDAAKRGMTKLFTLDEEATNTLLARARRDHADATSIYPFTRDLNQHLSPVEKRELISMLWKLAYTDAVLTGYEERAIRRIAELLHVSHGDFIAAKQRGRNAAEVSAKPPPGY